MCTIFGGKPTKNVKAEAVKKYEPVSLTEDKPKIVDGYWEVCENVQCERESKSGMSELEKRKFTEVVKNFTDEELAIVLEFIPAELCIDKIKREIDRAKKIETNLRDAVRILGN